MKRKNRVSIQGLFGIAVILLIGFASIVSAGFLPFFGEIIGSLNVEEPIFYLDGSQTLFEGDLTYRKMLLGEIPSEENESFIFGTSDLIFVSEEIGNESIGQMGFMVVIWVRTNTIDKPLIFRVLRLSSNLVENFMCEPPAVNIISEEFERYETGCAVDGVEMGEGDMFALVVTGVGGGEYYVKTGEEFEEGYSRLEVSLDGDAIAEIQELNLKLAREKISRKKSGGGHGDGGDVFQNEDSGVKDLGGIIGERSGERNEI